MANAEAVLFTIFFFSLFLNLWIYVQRVNYLLRRPGRWSGPRVGYILGGGVLKYGTWFGIVINMPVQQDSDMSIHLLLIPSPANVT